MRVSSAVCSSVGKKRKINQDNYFLRGLINKHAHKYDLSWFFASGKEQLYAVFDGMGGESNGEEASLVSAQILKNYQKKYSGLYSRFEEHMECYFGLANNQLCKIMEERKIRQIGSTAVVLCVSPKEKAAYVCNIGDSKAFLLRKGTVKMLSEDHNEAQSLVRLGVIDEEQARSHRGKSVLTQHLGISPNEMQIEPFFSDAIMLRKKDSLLLCSDGLTDMLTNAEIARIIEKKRTAPGKARALVAAANKKHSKDNVTALVVQVCS